MTKHCHFAVCCTPYLKKHTSCDCDFWYTCAKSPDAFSFFQSFDFLGCWGGGGGGLVKGKNNDLKLQKKSVPLTLYLKSYTSYDCGFWYTYVK